MAAWNGNSNGEGATKNGLVLWALAHDASPTRALVEQSATAFGMGVRFCTPSDVGIQARLVSAAVIGVEFTSDFQSGFDAVRSLTSQYPDTVVLAVLPDASIEGLRGALGAGATDVLTLPLSIADLNKAFLRAHQVHEERAATGSVDGEIFVIYGARGGLGATTLAVNLAVRIAALTNQKTAIADLDLQRGDVATFLNLASGQSFASFAQAIGEIDDAFLQGVLTRHPTNIHALVAPADIEEAGLVGRQHVARALDALRTRFRYIVVDTPRAITDVSIQAFEMATKTIILADLTIPGVRAAQRSLELLSRLEVPAEKVDLVVLEPVGNELKAEDAARAVGRKPSLTLPRDAAAATEAMNAGMPIDSGRGSPLSSVIGNIASALTGVAPVAEKSGGLRRLFGFGRSSTA